MAYHGDARPYCCQDCVAKFKTSSELSKHKRIHSNTRSYVCKECHAKFNVSSTLYHHKLKHIKERPHVCDNEGCDATFKSKYALNTHKKYHNNDKPHKCTYPGCKATYAFQCLLNMHSVIHTGEKPYVCREEGCGASFAFPSNLRLHHYSYHTTEGQAIKKKQEQRVHNALIAAGIEFEREVVIHFGPIGEATTRFARVDFVIKMADREILLEVDENQHSYGYGSAGCDVVRMACIIEALNTRPDEDEALLPKLFIRYNPHGYKVDGVTTRKLKRDREEALIAFLRDLPAADEDTPPLEVQYMFYDTQDGKPTVTSDPDYNTHFAECCRPAII